MIRKAGTVDGIYMQI